MNKAIEEHIKYVCENNLKNPKIIVVEDGPVCDSHKDSVDYITSVFEANKICEFNEPEKSVYMEVRANSNGVRTALNTLRVATAFSNTFEGVIGVDLTRFAGESHAEYFREFLDTLSDESESAGTVVFVNDDTVAEVVKEILGGTIIGVDKGGDVR